MSKYIPGEFALHLGTLVEALKLRRHEVIKEKQPASRTNTNLSHHIVAKQLVSSKSIKYDTPGMVTIRPETTVSQC